MQLGYQVARFAQMESARGHKQDVVGLDHAVFGAYRSAFNQRQQVALHALARYICAAALVAACYFVDFVNKNDAVLLGIF